MLLSQATTRSTTVTQTLLRAPRLTLSTLRFSSSSAPSPSPSQSATTIASSFLTRFQSLGPQTRVQTLDANQLRLLSLTLNRPSLFPASASPTLTTAPSATTSEPEIDLGTPLPAGYHLVYFTPAFLENELGADGTDTSYNPDQPFTRRMWAGGEVSWPRDKEGKVNPLRVGERVTETTRVLSAEGKVIRKTGEEMVVVGVEKEFRNERGVAVVDRRNWIFRKALPAPSPMPSPSTSNLPPASPPSAIPASVKTSSSPDNTTHTRTLVQTPVTLFRFSALTFNPHRIHYDHPWTREVEGHRNVVVHGPLNLISILDLWRDTRGLNKGPSDSIQTGEVDLNSILPEKISYRATSPIYAGDEYSIVLKEEGGGKGVVEVITPGGNVGMKAEILGI
ncbi:hypothetical protein BJY04DRAFT_214073 [Aspergillus karnatakaensis]|uniref:hydroxyacyl-thioester dehydratase HTD2 n=1 Tax=Aspergillus karnatakaensis TaxID=1810916 RepID=UPI003CCCA724